MDRDTPLPGFNEGPTLDPAVEASAIAARRMAENISRLCGQVVSARPAKVVIATSTTFDQGFAVTVRLSEVEYLLVNAESLRAAVGPDKAPGDPAGPVFMHCAVRDLDKEPAMLRTFQIIFAQIRDRETKDVD